jgi:hypothetical protein
LTLSNVSFLAFEFYASLLAIRLIAGLFQSGDVGRIWMAMWLPLVVLVVAGYLLFFNDQGRELGIGLMDLSTNGPVLGLVLVYWAVNNWLSARVGLMRAFPKPTGEQALVFWGPRLVGVGAHFLAAGGLFLAGLSERDVHDWRRASCSLYMIGSASCCSFRPPWLLFLRPCSLRCSIIALSLSEVRMSAGRRRANGCLL